MENIYQPPAAALLEEEQREVFFCHLDPQDDDYVSRYLGDVSGVLGLQAVEQSTREYAEKNLAIFPGAVFCIFHTCFVSTNEQSARCSENSYPAL